VATPALDAGVIERGKPFAWPSHLVWRFEGVLGNGSTITTPIFEIVQDGRPLTEVEVGAFAVVKVPGPRFGIAVLSQTTPNMRLTLQLIQDNGNPQPYRVLFVPTVDGTEVQFYEWKCPGRRCQFRLANTPLGTLAGSGSDTRFEITSEDLIGG
jgi:hypothetical protein